MRVLNTARLGVSGYVGFLVSPSISHELTSSRAKFIVVC